MKRHGGNKFILCERSQSDKATYYMILTIWHYGKEKNIEMVKRAVVAGTGRGRDEWIEHRRFSGQRKYSL